MIFSESDDSLEKNPCRGEDPLKFYLTQPYSLFKLHKMNKDEAHLILCSDNGTYHYALNGGNVTKMA